MEAQRGGGGGGKGGQLTPFTCPSSSSTGDDKKGECKLRLFTCQSKLGLGST